MMTIRALWPEIGLREARNFVDNAPQILRDDIDRVELQAVRSRFNDVGAVIELANNADGKLFK